MATVQIYRDAPIIASKVRPNGVMPNQFNQLDGRISISNYIFGDLTDDPEPEQLSLTMSSRRGNRGWRNNWVRTEWQTAF